MTLRRQETVGIMERSHVVYQKYQLQSYTSSVIDHRLIPVGNGSWGAPTTRPGMNKSQPTYGNKLERERIPEGRNQQGDD